MISSKQISLALISSLEDGASSDVVLKNFFIFLEKKHLKELLPNIINSLQLEIKRLEKEKTLHIKSSHTLEEGIIKKIEEYVEKDGKSKTVVTEDTDLIGGFTARYKGMFYDGSVKNSLKELKAILMK